MYGFFDVLIFDESSEGVDIHYKVAWVCIQMWWTSVKGMNYYTLPILAKIIRRHDSVLCVHMDQGAPLQIFLGEIAHVSILCFYPKAPVWALRCPLLIFQGHFLWNQCLSIQHVCEKHWTPGKNTFKKGGTYRSCWWIMAWKCIQIGGCLNPGLQCEDNQYHFINGTQKKLSSTIHCEQG